VNIEKFEDILAWQKLKDQQKIFMELFNGFIVIL
jgi:hypothetical protein